MAVSIQVHAKHVQVEGAPDKSTDVIVTLVSVDPVAVLTTILEGRMSKEARFELSQKIMAGLSAPNGSDPSGQE